MKADFGYRIFAAELEGQFPRRTPDFPVLYVALSRKKASSHANAVESILEGSGQYAKLLGRPRPDLVSKEIYSDRGDGNAEVTRIRAELSRRGYSINPRFDNRHRLYVVKLDETILNRPGERCVYVGTTSLPINVRFEQHRSGIRSARVAKAFREIDTKLTPLDKVFFSRWDAVAEETLLGQQLISRGFAVWGPQGLEAQ